MPPISGANTSKESDEVPLWYYTCGVGTTYRAYFSPRLILVPWFQTRSPYTPLCIHTRNVSALPSSPNNAFTCFFALVVFMHGMNIDVSARNGVFIRMSTPSGSIFRKDRLGILRRKAALPAYTSYQCLFWCPPPAVRFLAFPPTQLLCDFSHCSSENSAVSTTF